MTLAQIKTYIYRRTKTNSTSFSDADMAVELTAANEHALSLIRTSDDLYFPTAWTAADVTAGTLSPLFDALYHELVPLWVIYHYTTDNRLRSDVASEIKIKETGLKQFYAGRNLRPFTVTIAAPGVFTIDNHQLESGQQVILTTTGALPTGLTGNTYYYVLPIDRNTFWLSATNYGPTAVTTTGTQSGTHYLAYVRPAQITTEGIRFR